jgi:hypothetical protein
MSVLWIEFDLTNEPILLPVALHSEGCEFSQQIGKYRGIVQPRPEPTIMRVWFAKILADFEINDIAALPPLFCYNS